LAPEQAARLVVAGESSTAVDLEELERAQQDYRDVLKMLAETMPFEAWRKWRPRYLKPAHYRAWVGGLEAMKDDLEREFGALLLAGPAISEQRRRPH
jgi:hypothetical protein